MNQRKTWRQGLRVRGRIALSLCLIATLATLLTLVVPQYRLAGDLEEASLERLERATKATAMLVARRQEQMRERHRTMAQTPEFRANLGTADVPTLDVLAQTIVSREGLVAAAVFTNSRGALVAASGDPSLRSMLMGTEFANPVSACGSALPSVGCDEVAGHGDPILFVSDGRLIAGTSIPLFVRGRFIGRAAFMEIQDAAVLEEWSSLAGGTLALRESVAPRDLFERVAVSAPPFELRVRASFDAEQAALIRLRTMILTSGLFALFVAFVLANPLSQSVLAPLWQIEAAALRIRGGDRSTRLESDRTDEFGDVARAFNTMLDHLESTQAGLERAQAIGRIGGWSLVEGEHRLNVSRELRKILDLEAEGDVVDRALIESRIHPADLEQYRNAFKRWHRDGSAFGFDHRVLRGDGSERIVHTRAERISTSAGVHRIEGTIQDVTERKQIEERVTELAYHDVLTGLGNRRLFAEDLQKAISLGRQHLQPLALLFLDLDDFKIINDTLGHSVGDELLCVIADFLIEIVEEMEGEVGAASVHRLGGDEFAIILPQLEDWESARSCAEAIGRRLATSVDLDGYDVQMSASIGIATWPDEGLEVASLLLGCDNAMYNAKLEGRGQYRFYNPSMRENSKRRLQMETRLRRAIEHDELEIVYQPKVEPITGRVAGFEALLRWRDGDLGPVSPAEFVPLAEETGQILALGEWVLNTVAHQARQWVDAGVLDASIAVNVSSYQIESDTLVDLVVGILRETGLPPHYLELEITETALLRQEERAIRTLGELKDAGVQLALDDFGTGYSSLSYLRRLPIDSVKIDQSFIGNILRDEQDRALVASIISMAHVLGLSVIVEGVEERGQRDLLVEMDCEMIQGYFYSEGVSADRVPEIVSEGFPSAST